MKQQPRFVFIALTIIVGLTFGCSKTEKATPSVLFDQSHGQHFLIQKEGPLDLSALAKIFGKQGFDVRSSTEQIGPALLENIDALVLSGPFSPITEPEIKAITEFLQNGGKLCIMLHIASPPAALLKTLGVAISNGPILEQSNLIEGSPLNFKVTRLKQHPLTAGLSGFNVYGCWAAINTGDNAEVLAVTSPQAWIDLNRDNRLGPGDAMQTLGLIVAGRYGKGTFVVFGDDAIFQNQFLREGNERLAGNLATWMKSNKK